MASSNLLHDWKPIGEEEEAVLEATYKKNPEPPSAVKLDLALELHVSPQNIGRWFSARRKRDQGETRAQRKLPEQVEILEKYFKQNPFPSRAEKAMICNETGCSLKQINSWFQHSRKKRNMTNLDNLPGDYLRTWHEQAAKHIKSAIIAQNTKIFGPQDDGDPEEEDDGGAAAGAEFDDEEDYDEEEDEEDAEDFSPPPSSSKGKGRSSTGGGGGSGSRSSYDPAGTLNTTPRAVTPPSFEHEHEDSTPRAGSSGQAMRRSTRKVSSQPRAAERYIPYSTPDDDASPRGPAAGHRRHASSASMRSFNSTDSGATKVHQSAGGSPLTGHQRLEVPDSHNPHHLRSRGESPEEMGGNRMSSPYGMPNQVARVQPQQQTSGGPSSPAGFGDVQPTPIFMAQQQQQQLLQMAPGQLAASGSQWTPQIQPMANAAATQSKQMLGFMDQRGVFHSLPANPEVRDIDGKHGIIPLDRMPSQLVGQPPLQQPVSASVSMFGVPTGAQSVVVPSGQPGSLIPVQLAEARPGTPYQQQQQQQQQQAQQQLGRPQTPAAQLFNNGQQQVPIKHEPIVQQQPQQPVYGQLGPPPQRTSIPPGQQPQSQPAPQQQQQQLPQYGIVPTLQPTGPGQWQPGRYPETVFTAGAAPPQVPVTYNPTSMPFPTTFVPQFYQPQVLQPNQQFQYQLPMMPAYSMPVPVPVSMPMQVIPPPGQAVRYAVVPMPMVQGMPMTR